MLSGELVGVRVLSGEIGKDVVRSGGGGTTNYNNLGNKPQINGVELVGNKTSEELGLANKSDVPVVPTKISGFENDAGYATGGYVDQKVADLVNAAPETLDTLGEVARAIEENADVVEALNSAIGKKADKSSVPMFAATQLEDGSYSLSITTPLEA